MKSTVSVRGQTVIPAEIRKRHGIKPHTRLIWLDDGQTIRVIPVPDDPIEAMRGMFKGGGLTEALLADRHQEREREEAEIGQWLRGEP
jgi:AbrB family looped-hinge helix DNA binding protein